MVIFGILNSWSIDFTCEAECEEGEELYTLNLFDSYGDGWDHGSGHLVTINGVDYGGYDFTTGTSFSYTICLDPTDCLDFSFTDGGLWEYECSYNLLNNSGVTIFSEITKQLIKLLEIAPLLAVQILRLVISTLMLKMMMVVVFTHL